MINNGILQNILFDIPSPFRDIVIQGAIRWQVNIGFLKSPISYDDMLADYNMGKHAYESNMGPQELVSNQLLFV